MHGSIVNASEGSGAAGDELVYVAPQHGTLRKNLGVFVPEDGGSSWQHAADRTKNRSGYSDVVMLDLERAGLLYEGSDARDKIVFQVAELP
ncbi:hypothetical protein ACT3SP_08890 [Brachybacterium sp. AOP43-C2-M15]|uniref:hypothetical protein n=1 Tax=Brachybacterium sp. AOP43-C2-M15 TaxID=3457661 RepID=UPI0040346CBF